MDEFDVIVLGTGAAGLVAAVSAAERGARVGLFERSDLVGGTTAMSGGVIWMPNNHHMADLGLADTRDDALAYLHSLSLGYLDPTVAEAFVDEGPKAVQWVEEHTPCRFFVVDGYPDYHPDHPGGRPGGGRSLDNEVFSFDELGSWAERVRNQRGPTPLTLSDTAAGGATTPPDPELIAERSSRNANGLGLALVGALLKGCLDRGVEPQLEHRAVGLDVDDGRVRGVRFETPNGPRTVVAHRGVVLATGGFEWAAEMVRTYLRGPMTGPASTPTNTGDGLRMAVDAGAELGNMTGAWWAPVSRIPGETTWGQPRVRLVLPERTRPRSIMVNGNGNRFCNEAGNYNAMGGVFHSFDPATFSYPNQPAWLVFDHAYLTTYDILAMPPTNRAPAWMASGDTLRALAAVIGVPADALEATVVRFNEHARAGLDPDFGRGNSPFDHFNGDRRLPEPFTTLGPLDQPPFYAIKVECGTLGTNGGPRVDAQARVISSSGGVIDGLFAAGNVMASPTGMAYGGAGGTLGPAITFGYIAGRQAAGSD
jgi:succinate dehydrogenase/fumarate reductase flavoprotein subunit